MGLKICWDYAVGKALHLVYVQGSYSGNYEKEWGQTYYLQVNISSIGIFSNLRAANGTGAVKGEGNPDF